MLKLLRIRVIDSGEYDTYFVQFAIEDDEPDFLSAELSLRDEETLDDLVKRARAEVIEKLRSIVNEG